MVAWSFATCRLAAAKRLEPFCLCLRFRCSLRSRFSAERRNFGGAIFSPADVTARDAKPRSMPTALPLAGSGVGSTSTTKLAK